MIKDDKERIQISIKKTLLTCIEEYSFKTGISKSDIITIAIYEYLQREELKVRCIENQRGVPRAFGIAGYVTFGCHCFPPAMITMLL